jgi:hypothetical protein
MKHLPLLLLAALGFAAEEAPRSPFHPEGSAPEGRANPRLPVPLSPDEQKRLREAMEKAKQDPAVKEAHEQAAKAQQAAQEAQKKARDSPAVPKASPTSPAVTAALISRTATARAATSVSLAPTAPA